MAHGPHTTEHSQRTQWLIASLAEQIDLQLADSTDPELTAKIAPPQPLSGGVAEGLRSRYLNAGWAEVSFRETDKSLGSVQYKVTLRR